MSWSKRGLLWNNGCLCGGKFAPFSDGACFYVESPLKEPYKYPVVRTTVSQDEYIVFMLAKAGWYDGNPSAIYATPVDRVMKSYHYEIMSREYESTFQQLNKADKWK